MATTDSILPMNTVPHLSPIKLSASNYLIWRNHMTLLVALHKLSDHIDGSSSPPSETITADDKTTSNPAFVSWTAADQKAALLLLSSLTEEAAAEVLGLTSARQIWLAFENTYSNASVERIQSLRDTLRQLTKGTSSATEFSRRFKTLCEQLAAIGHPVAEIDKLHWFLCGLGPSYEIFSTAIRATKPAPKFHDLLAQRVMNCSYNHSMALLLPQLRFMRTTAMKFQHKVEVVSRQIEATTFVGLMAGVVVAIVGHPIVNYVARTGTMHLRVRIFIHMPLRLHH